MLSIEIFNHLETLRKYPDELGKTSQALASLKSILPEKFHEKLDKLYPISSSEQNQTSSALSVNSQVPYDNFLFYAELFHSVEQNGIPKEHAAKLATLFESTEKAFSYLKKYLKINPQTRTLMHDACLFVLPQADYDLKTWRRLSDKFLQEENFRKHILPHASEIEKLIKAGTKTPRPSAEAIRLISNDIENINAKFKKLKRQHGILTDDERHAHDKLLVELHAARLELTALGPSFDEQLSLVALNAFKEKLLMESSEAFRYFIEHGLTKADYAKFIALARADSLENIPDIRIDGASLGYPGFYLIKVPVIDELHAARAACLGKLTNCCQSLSGEAGEQCTIYGLTSVHSGFYVVCQGNVHEPQVSDEVQGQSWVWRSQKQAIGLDSIEVKTNADQNTCEMMNAFMQHLAKELVIQGHTHKVFCGAISGISSQVGLDSFLNDKEEFIDYSGYCDSAFQRVLYDKDKPFCWYNEDDDCKVVTDAMITEALKGSVPLVNSILLQQALNWAVVHDNQELIDNIKSLAFRESQSRLDEVESQLDFINNYLKGTLSINDIFTHVKEHPALVNIRAADGKTLLMIFSNADYSDLASDLIDVGAAVDAKDSLGNTALHYAVMEQQFDLMKLLIDSGADINAKNHYGKTPLLCAAEKSFTKAAQILIRRNADIHATDGEDMTAMLWAIQNGNVALASELINKGVDVNAKYDDNITALILACGFNHRKLALFLIENDADVNAMSGERSQHVCPMSYALNNGDEKIILALIDNGVDVDSELIDGSTILIWASANNHPKLILPLIVRGANIHATDNNGKSALLRSLESGHIAIAKMLIENGVNPNERFQGGVTALMVAAEYGFLELATILLDKHAEVNARDDAGYTALLFACENNQVDFARTLISKGAEIDPQDNNGFTPLMVACIDGHFELALALLNKGADLYIENNDNQTALSIAIEYGNPNFLLALVRSKTKESEKMALAKDILSLTANPEIAQIIWNEIKTIEAKDNHTNVNGKRTAPVMSSQPAKKIASTDKGPKAKEDKESPPSRHNPHKKM